MTRLDNFLTNIRGSDVRIITSSALCESVEVIRVKEDKFWGLLYYHPQELPRFKELIFEDFSKFLLVENIYEEVVLQSVSKDIMMGEEGGGVFCSHCSNNYCSLTRSVLYFMVQL